MANSDLFGAPKIADVGPRGVSARIKLTPGPSETLHLVQLQGSAAANMQFDLSFTDNVFATVYGDKLTTFSITGVSFPSDVMCDGTPPDIVEYYKQYKAQRSTIPQVSVGFNNFVFQGVLVEMSVSPYSLQSIDAFSVTLVIYGRIAS